MISRSEILDEFSMMCSGRHTLDAGTVHYEGYFNDVTEHDIGFVSGGPMADPNHVFRIPLDSIDLSSLWYCDDSKKTFVHAEWSDWENKWILLTKQKRS